VDNNGALNGGVAALSSSSVWAVGFFSNGPNFRTLSEHWNGQRWSVIPSRSIAGTDNQLYAVTTPAANDIWAIGIYNGSAGAQALGELFQCH
jgi:hypothetical protein